MASVIFHLESAFLVSCEPDAFHVVIHFLPVKSTLPRNGITADISSWVAETAGLYRSVLVSSYTLEQGR